MNKLKLILSIITIPGVLLSQELSLNILLEKASYFKMHDYVHETNEAGKKAIMEKGLDPEVSGYVTKYKYIQNIKDPFQFSEQLYKQKFWTDPIIANRFNNGAYILRISQPYSPQFQGITNIRYLTPQWHFGVGTIKPEYIQPIRIIFPPYLK